MTQAKESWKEEKRWGGWKEVNRKRRDEQDTGDDEEGWPEVDDSERVGADTPYEEAEEMAVSLAKAFGMSNEAIRELIERKRREHQEQMARQAQVTK